MASGKQGILGALSGRVANVVCSSWKGIAVFKSLPASVANPRTTLQMEQRTRMSNVVAFAGKINTPVIKPLWDRFQSEKSGYNAFVQQNINLFDSKMPTEPDSLVISRGKMVATEITMLSVNKATAVLTVEWSNVLQDSYAQASDKPFIVAYNAQTEEIVGIESGNTREDQAALVTIPGIVHTADTIHCYLAFRRADGTIVSNNSYKYLNVV